MGTAAQSTSDLSSRIDFLVKQQIATGRFQTSEQVLVEALETLRDVEELAEPVRAELRERLKLAGKGFSLPLDRAAFFAGLQ